jgi:hypothetical protein
MELHLQAKPATIPKVGVLNPCTTLCTNPPHVSYQLRKLHTSKTKLLITRTKLFHKPNVKLIAPIAKPLRTHHTLLTEEAGTPPQDHHQQKFQPRGEGRERRLCSANRV